MDTDGNLNKNFGRNKSRNPGGTHKIIPDEIPEIMSEGIPKETNEGMSNGIQEEIFTQIKIAEGILDRFLGEILKVKPRNLWEGSDRILEESHYEYMKEPRENLS